MASSDAEYRSYYLKQDIKSILGGDTIRQFVHLYCSGLLDSISTLRDGKEYRPRKTVQRIRDSFESATFGLWVSIIVSISPAGIYIY